MRQFSTLLNVFISLYRCLNCIWVLAAGILKSKYFLYCIELNAMCFKEINVKKGCITVDIKLYAAAGFIIWKFGYYYLFVLLRVSPTWNLDAQVFSFYDKTRRVPEDWRPSLLTNLFRLSWDRWLAVGTRCMCIDVKKNFPPELSSVEVDGCLYFRLSSATSCKCDSERRVSYGVMTR